jgi:hypothetical protein
LAGRGGRTSLCSSLRFLCDHQQILRIPPCSPPRASQRERRDARSWGLPIAASKHNRPRRLWPFYGRISATGRCARQLVWPDGLGASLPRRRLRVRVPPRVYYTMLALIPRSACASLRYTWDAHSDRSILLLREMRRRAPQECLCPGGL